MPAPGPAPALCIVATGMVTGVGLSAAATSAAVRAAIDNFQESRFRDARGQWLLACPVSMPEPCGGERKLCKMVARAIVECLDGIDAITLRSTPLLLCLADPGRPGRIIAHDAAFLAAVAQETGMTLHAQSAVIAEGHVSAARALQRARALLRAPAIPQVLVAACDSLLVGAALRDCERRERLMTSENPDGIIAGEAAAALLVQRMTEQRAGQLACRGLGFALEPAHVGSEQPLRADGLVAAIREALRDAQCGEGILAFKIIDAAGDSYAFKETALAFGRIDRTKRTEFDVWHPADCIGEVGAPIGLIMLAVLKAACEKGYARGDHVLLHLGNDDGRRAAMICSWNWQEGQDG